MSQGLKEFGINLDGLLGIETLDSIQCGMNRDILGFLERGHPDEAKRVAISWIANFYQRWENNPEASKYPHVAEELKRIAADAKLYESLRNALNARSDSQIH